MFFNKSAIILGALFFALSSSGIRADAAVMDSHETAVIASFSSGDYGALADTLEAMITEHPLEPISVLHYSTLFQMAKIFGTSHVDKSVRTIKEILRNSPGDNAGSCMVQFNCELERMLYQTKGAQGKQITDELKPVRKWTLYGPYQRYGAGDMDFPFQPEILSTSREISPQRRITITDSDGWLDAGKYLFPDNGVVYASVSFRIRMPVKIRLYSNSSYKVFINGREAVRNMLHSRRNLRIIRVDNSQGVTVTVKMSGSPFEKLRMLVTDEHNASIEPEIIPEASFMNECDVSDDLDYPYDMLANDALKNPGKGNERLGLFFDNLDSKEAIDYYRKSVEKQKNGFSSYLLAAALLETNSGERGSAGYNKGLGIINDLREKLPDFVPAWQKKVEYLIRTREYLLACREGKKLVSRTPRNPFSFEAYVRILNAIGYEKEAGETIAVAKKYFPEFINIREEEAEYYKKRDRNKFIAISLELIQRDFSLSRGRSLLREYISRGDYQPALNLIQIYNFNNDFNKELIEIHIKMGNFKAARDLIFQALLVHESPYLYYALGLIDMLQVEDPSMYLQKLLNIQPSLFVISDYIQYLDSNELANPFSRFLDRMEQMKPPSFKNEFGQVPSTVLYRGRIFLLQNDGGSRVFCEDIVHVSNEEGVSRWGDIKIPYRGRISPVHLRVYDEKGITADSYTMQKIRNDTYVNINSLKKNSIIHLSYIVDNPIVTPAGSRLFSLPLEFLQHYDEPVRRVSIKVIAPAGINVHFLFKNKVPVKKSAIEGLQQYEAVIENIPSIKQERFSGGRQNCLYYYSLSTMDGFADFAAWYQGLLAGKTDARQLPVEQFKKNTIEKTIIEVYNFVAREIELQRNVLFFPDAADNTLFRKSGSAEDKVLLARTLLEHLGIRSYIAFARNRFLPGAGTYIYPEYFTHILLCVPLDISNVLWLDFSSRYFRCGVTASAVTGSNAVVLLNDSYRIRQVHSLDARSAVSRYNIVIGDDGSSLCDAEAAFVDSSGEIRSYFNNPLYWEESVHRFFNVILPGFTMDTFRVENYKDCDRPFIIAAKGAGFGITIADSHQIIIHPVLNKCEVYDYVTVPQRAHPLVLEKTIDEKETYRYSLPSQFSREEITRTHILKNRFGSCRVVIKKKSGSPVLEVEKEIHINAMVILPIEYNEFLNFCLELKRIENDTVILKK